MRSTTTAIRGLIGLVCTLMVAQAVADETVGLEPITVTAPGLARDLHRTPAAVSVIGEADLQQARQRLQLDESLNRAPGVLFQNRYNFAQNLRMSIRGFGARAPFGIRGIRLRVDGFPETLPDGQSQVDGIDLESVRHVEVIRGPSSALYGNAAGGVVDIHTAEPSAEPFIDFRGSAGSHDFWRLGMLGGGQNGPWGAHVSVWRLGYDGYRAQNRTEKQMLNTRLRYTLDEARSLSLFLTALDQPRGQDPGGLVREEAAADRRQAAPNALNLDAGQTVKQQRVGIVYRDSALLPGELSVRSFYTWRDFSQQLPFPGPSLIEFERDFYGGAVDYSDEYGWGALPGGRPLRYTAGIELARQRDDRRRFLVDGDANRAGQIQDALETATSSGAYGQADVPLTRRLDLTLGGRYDRVRFRIDDRHTPDGAASGSRSYDEFSVALGLGLELRPAHHAYVSVGSSYETPSFTEFYDPTEPAEGFDPGIGPQQAVNTELGVKGFLGHDTRYELAAFVVRTRDEIVQIDSEPDRFSNAARTRRSGLEAGLEYQLTPALRVTGAYAWTRYRFQEFRGQGGEDFAGHRLPGLPEHILFGELAWRDPGGVYAILDTLILSGVYADNANQESVSGYGIANLRVGVRRPFNRVEVEAFAAVNNFTDRRYFSNIRINAAGGRYFEPAPERNYFAGMQLHY